MLVQTWFIADFNRNVHFLFGVSNTLREETFAGMILRGSKNPQNFGITYEKTDERINEKHEKMTIIDHFSSCRIVLIKHKTFVS